MQTLLETFGFSAEIRTKIPKKIDKTSWCRGAVIYPRKHRKRLIDFMFV